jgi:hypothetical protein
MLTLQANFFVACRHEAQPCYCGEPNCVGFIGGKTQTDLASMDDLYLDGATWFNGVFSLTNTFFVP